MQTSAGVQGEHQNEHGMTRYQTCFRSCWDFPTQSSPRFTEDGLNVTGEQQFSGRRCFSDVREEVCRAWQEGKSDSNNHLLPPKSFSECTSCWKADGLQQHQTTGRHIAQLQTETWGCSMHRLSVADFGTNIITAWIPPALNQWCYSVRDISTSMPFWPQCTNSCRTMCNKAPVL